MRWESYIRALIDRIFKLLPMREETDIGINNYLDVFLSDLAEELTGSYDTFPELYSYPNYVMVVSTLNSLRHGWADLPFPIYRRSILKMTNTLTRLLEEVAAT